MLNRALVPLLWLITVTSRSSEVGCFRFVDLPINIILYIIKKYIQIYTILCRAIHFWPNQIKKIMLLIQTRRSTIKLYWRYQISMVTLLLFKSTVLQMFIIDQLFLPLDLLFLSKSSTFTKEQNCYHNNCWLLLIRLIKV